MESPVKVIGFEVVTQQNGKTGIRIYGVRDLSGQDAFGQEAVRIYINPEYCKYEPEIGHLIIAVEGRYGVDRIIRVG